jgi:hypothetical protein
LDFALTEAHGLHLVLVVDLHDLLYVFLLAGQVGH